MTGATRRYVVVLQGRGRLSHGRKAESKALGPFEYGEALDVQRQRGGRVKTLASAETRSRVDAALSPRRRRAA